MRTRSLSVRALDIFLNRQILASPSGGLGWWRAKIRAKRLLERADPAKVERLARRILAILRRPVTPARRLAA